ncbi:MAG: hypothetical protein AAB551_00830 [Patescibacteria group bacterium]
MKIAPSGEKYFSISVMVVFLFSVLAVPAFAQDAGSTPQQTQNQNSVTNPPARTPRPTTLQQGCEPNGHTEWMNPSDMNDTRTMCVSHSQQNGSQNFGQQNFGDRNMNPQDLERAKKQFLGDRGFTQTVKTIQRLIKKLPAGYSASQEVLDALAKVDALSTRAQNATDMDTLSDVREDLNDVMDVLRQAEWQLRSLSDVASMEKRATKELVKLNKKLTRFETNVSKEDVDTANLLRSARTAIETATTALQKAVQTAKSGDVEEAQSEFQDFFEGLGETWQTVGMLDAVRGISKGISMIEKNVAAAKKRILALSQKSKKIDASEILDLLQEASGKVAELKSLVKSSDFQPEDAMSLFMELNDLRQQIEASALETFGGEGMDIHFFPMEMGRVPDMNFGPGSGSGPGSHGGPQGGFGGDSMMGPQGGNNFGPQGGQQNF